MVSPLFPVFTSQCPAGSLCCNESTDSQETNSFSDDIFLRERTARWASRYMEIEKNNGKGGPPAHVCPLFVSSRSVSAEIDAERDNITNCGRNDLPFSKSIL